MRIRNVVAPLGPVLAAALAVGSPAHSAVSPGPTPAAENRPAPLTERMWHTGSSFVADVGYVVSAPARLERSGVLWTLGFLAATGVIYAYDQEILDACQRSRDNDVYHAAVHVGDQINDIGHMGKTSPYYLGAALLGTAFGLEELQNISTEILESHLISGGIRNSAKLFAGRRRPYEGLGPRFFEFNGGTSFPSGHASVAFELATILSHHARGAPGAVSAGVTALCYGLATTIAMERVDSRNHWPSDVFLAAVSGTTIARTVVRRNEERRGERASAVIVPGACLADGRPGVLFAFRF